MGFLERIFGSSNDRSSPKPVSLRQELRDLEKKADAAPLGTGWAFLNRAGDVCLRFGDRVKAVDYFGRAIDALLEDGQPEPARGLAKKIIRIHPEAIRTLCTLTWLDLGARQPTAAVQSLRDYVKAAKRGKREERAAEQILAMSRISDDPAFLRRAATSLSDMGFAADGDKVREWLEDGGGPDSEADDEALARYCLNAAVAPNGPDRRQGQVA